MKHQSKPTMSSKRPIGKSKAVQWPALLDSLKSLRKSAGSKRAAMAVELDGVGVESFRAFQHEARQARWEVSVWPLPKGHSAMACMAIGKRVLVTITVTTDSDYGAIIPA